MTIPAATRRERLWDGFSAVIVFIAAFAIAHLAAVLLVPISVTNGPVSEEKAAEFHRLINHRFWIAGALFLLIVPALGIAVEYLRGRIRRRRGAASLIA